MSEFSRLLIDEPPLVVLPSLTRVLDINKAVILQQIQYWIVRSDHVIDDHRWIYNSYKEWAVQFPWITARAVRHHIRGLEQMGLLISGDFNKDPRDNTKWYRIDYAAVDLLVTDATDGVTNLDMPPAAEEMAQVTGTASPLPETTSKTTTENTTIDVPDSIEIAPDSFYVLSMLERELVSELWNLPNWNHEAKDAVWVYEFRREFPEIGIALIRACRDYWDGRKRVVPTKGTWKTRLRNFLTKRRQWSDTRGDGDLGVPDEAALAAKATSLGIGEEHAATTS